ncbi:hypothetical protein V5O48_005712 [Marasmius crinis-equi]|uniref:Uncharacterized protein n=1 Tax=Marasmius crinis-equi TaxID=585013 RepID=A0ABR3FLJ3_9AGAR
MLPATFLAGDALDPSFVSGRGPCNEPPSGQLPKLESLKTLIPLQGRISAIHAGNVFHLFDKDKQLELARAFSSLLRPASGSVIFGCQATKEIAGEHTTLTGKTVFFHSTDSWTGVWNGAVFPAGSVKVNTKLIPIESSKYGVNAIMIWSCTIS